MHLARTVALASALVLGSPPLGAQAPADPATAQAVAAPQLLSEPVVTYPEGASGDARVVLVLVVDAEGHVTSATPEGASEPFASAAAAAALGFRFAPARRGDVPIPAKIRFEVVFREPPRPQPEPEPEPPPASKEARAPAARPAVEAPLELDVLGERPEPSRSASLSRAEVRELPGAFGDPFRAIEALPGVTPIVSGLPFFFIRGAPPGNAGYFLDGVRVPLLFHVGIGPSVVHPALIERVDLYPGGYPARFGRYAGGIVSGETAAPQSELHGEYNLRLFDAGALAEAPFAGQRGAVLLAGRYSYTAALLTVFSPETILQYWDYQARAAYDLSADDTVSVFGFGSYDYLGQKTQSETLTLFGTEFHRADLRWDRRLGAAGKLRFALTGGLDRSRAQLDRYVRDRVLGGRVELEQRLSRSALLRAGADLQSDTYDVETGTANFSPAAARVASLFPSRTDLALGTRADVVFDAEPRLTVTPGLRIDFYSSDGASAVAIDPRLALRATASQRVALLAAYGVAHQPPSFVIPVPGFQPGGLRGGLQRAIQESFGVETKLGDGVTLTATAFHNAFFQMSDPLGVREPELDGCAPGAYPQGTLGGDRGEQPEGSPDCGDRFEPGTLGPDRSGGGGQGADSRGGRTLAEVFEVRTLGSAYGLELLLKRDLTRDLGGFLAYTLSRSVRSYGSREYVAAFDRTHVLNLALSYHLGRRWRAGSRVMFYTGLPKPPDPSDASTRLPAFFRLDVRLEKRWQLTRTLWIAGVAEWMNATLSTEAVSTTCTLAGCEAETIGPVTIPSLGVEGGF
jgi:hypothetical protein